MASIPDPTMREAARRAELRQAARQALRDVVQTAPRVPLTPAEEEAGLRDMLAGLLSLMGAPADDIDRMYWVVPDGSRVAALERLVATALGQGPQPPVVGEGVGHA